MTFTMALKLALAAILVVMVTDVQGLCRNGPSLMVPHAKPSKYFFVFGKVAMAMGCSRGTFFNPKKCGCFKDDGPAGAPRVPVACSGRWENEDPHRYNEIIFGYKVFSRPCSLGTKFNKVTCLCDILSRVKVIPTSASQSGNGTVKATTSNLCDTYREEPGNPTKYQQRVNGVYFTRNCALGTSFDNATCSCSRMLGARVTKNKVGAPDSCRNKRPHPSDPRRYIHVVGGIEYTRNCSLGTVFEKTTCRCIIPAATREPETTAAGVTAGAVGAEAQTTESGTWEMQLLDGVKGDLALCEGCLIDNDYGFNPFPGDCRRYVQCAVNRALQGQDTFKSARVRTCGAGLFWSQLKLTCVLPANAQCEQNQCRGKADGTLLTSEHFCGSYLECSMGLSTSKCCPRGQIFSQENGACVTSNRNCVVDCVLVKRQTKTQLACNGLKPMDGDRSMYQQWVEGRGYLNVSCARGLWFDPQSCRCDYIPAGATMKTPQGTASIRRGCMPDAHYTFEADEVTTSLALYNVREEEGALRFHGNGYVGLSRFANYDFRGLLQIELNVTLPADLNTDKNYTLLANCYLRVDGSQGACYPPSIYLGIRTGHSSSVYAFLFTDSAGRRLSGPGLVPGQPTKVVLRYDGATMSLHVGNRWTEAPLSGLVLRKQSSLFLGRRARISDIHFVGDIDEVKVSKCVPSNV